MIQINNNKDSVRAQVKAFKRSMTDNEITEKSRVVINKIMNLDEYANCTNLFTYVNYNQEVITTELIKKSLKAGKKVFVPKIFGKRHMEFLRIYCLEDLEKGNLGILEPKGDILLATDIRSGFFLMPGLAFDRSFHRIGYGGGFYDTYLSQDNDFIIAAVGFDFQLFDNIPFEEHDLCPQIIITNEDMLFE